MKIKNSTIQHITFFLLCLVVIACNGPEEQQHTQDILEEANKDSLNKEIEVKCDIFYKPQEPYTDNEFSDRYKTDFNPELIKSQGYHYLEVVSNLHGTIRQVHFNDFGFITKNIKMNERNKDAYVTEFFFSNNDSVTKPDSSQVYLTNLKLGGQKDFSTRYYVTDTQTASSPSSAPDTSYQSPYTFLKTYNDDGWVMKLLLDSTIVYKEKIIINDGCDTIFAERHKPENSNIDDTSNATNDKIDFVHIYTETYVMKDNQCVEFIFSIENDAERKKRNRNSHITFLSKKYAYTAAGLIEQIEKVSKNDRYENLETLSFNYSKTAPTN